jgi:hypothetical protein
MPVQALWDQLKIGAHTGILYGNYPFARNIYYVGANPPPLSLTKATIAAALTDVISGDVIMLGPQTFQEGNLVLAAGKNNITIIGTGNRGSTRIAPINAGDEGLQILGDDCTLLNVEVTANATGDYAVRVGSSTVFPLRTTFNACKFRGTTAANPAAGLRITGALDLIVHDCEFASLANCILFEIGAGAETPKRIHIRNSWFYNYTTVGLGVVAASVVKNLAVENNLFARQEDNTTPTDFILLSDNLNTGFISGNHFENATNAATVLTIGTGLFWGPNGTEAGWSTARPV